MDFFLISGGGNGLVGKFDFEYILRKNPTGTSPSDFMNKIRFDRKLSEIRNAYADLIDYCNQFSKNNNIGH